MSKKLLIVNPDQNMELPLEQQLTIGRDVYNSLSLLDADVSRSHAIIFEQDDKAVIKDLNSRNGVYVNGTKVTEQPLADGDEITLGSTILVFNPPPNFDPLHSLTPRGQHILKKRAAQEQAPRSGPVNVYSCDRMERVIQRVLNQSEEGAKFFTVTNALALLKAFREMDAAADGTELCQIALKRTMALLGGDRGVIMETDNTKTKLKVRSILSTEPDSRRIEIPQQVLKVVLQSESCVFCGNVLGDAMFENIARERHPIHSFIASPVCNGKSYFGFMYLDSEDKTLEYDFVAMRSLFLVASHLAALLIQRRTHFEHSRAPAQIEG